MSPGSLWDASPHPIEIRDGTTSCASCPFYFFLGLTGLSSGRHVFPCFRGHRGLGKAPVTRTRILLLRAALRDRVRSAKGAERVGYG